MTKDLGPGFKSLPLQLMVFKKVNIIFGGSI